MPRDREFAYTSREAVGYSSVAMSSFEVLAALFARDVDRSLLRRSLAKTPTQRLEWLEEIQAFAEAAKTARHEAATAPRTTD